MTLRYVRPPFDFTPWPQASKPQQNRLLFDWWCDEGDRRSFIAALNGMPTWMPSCAPLELDPTPPLDVPAPQGWRQIMLLSDPKDLQLALTDTDKFGNLPYALLGRGSFMLALDPGGNPDWHATQRQAITQLLASYPGNGLQALAALSVRQAGLLGLASPRFDVCRHAELAAGHYFAQLFGFSLADLPLIETASRATYRALQYLSVGQHFVLEPDTVPAAQRALAQLARRVADLMDEYARLQRSPRRYGLAARRDWPGGVQAWSEIPLAGGSLATALGQPALRRLLGNGPWADLSGRDLAIVVATLIAGTIGHLQTSCCRLMSHVMGLSEAQRQTWRQASVDQLKSLIASQLSARPPISALPRRTKGDVVLSDGNSYPAGTECLLLLEAMQTCPHLWGGVAAPATAPHECLGQGLSLELLAALLHQLLHLPGLKQALDPLTLEPLDPEFLWGFGCQRYALQYERERRCRQRNLIVSMRIKSPVSENAAKLRRVVGAAAARIEQALDEFRGIHFAWFEITDDEGSLVLRTIYNGDFDAYVEHFALSVGDLFDQLFDYIEDAPPRPVDEHPHEFVQTIRRFNRAPLADYLYSAYPGIEAATVAKLVGAKP